MIKWEKLAFLFTLQELVIELTECNSCVLDGGLQARVFEGNWGVNCGEEWFKQQVAEVIRRLVSDINDCLSTLINVIHWPILCHVNRSLPSPDQIIMLCRILEYRSSPSAVPVWWLQLRDWETEEELGGREAQENPGTCVTKWDGVNIMKEKVASLNGH